MKAGNVSVASLAIAVLLGLGCTSTDGSRRQQARPSSSTPGASTLRLEGLDKAQTFEDLSRYGLVPPSKHNHEAGSQLILLALKATSLGKGDWFMAHGLLGVTMLDVDVVEGLGYRSLFLPYALGGWKLHASLNTNNNGLLLEEPERLPVKSASIIARREAALYGLAYHLQARYIYDDAGNFARRYGPSHYPRTNGRLRDCVLFGMTTLRELKERGFEDRTLRDALGIAFASLDREGAMQATSDVFALGSIQVFRDALDAALNEFRRTPQHSADVLEEIGNQMAIRNLTVDDEMLLPESQEALDALLKVVSVDLAALNNRSALAH